VLALLLIAQGTNRRPFGDLALVLAVVSFVGAIAYLRFVEAFRED
jgi:multisubunit Na+/H+ antiporter MnhF subunit